MPRRWPSPGHDRCRRVRHRAGGRPWRGRCRLKVAQSSARPVPPTSTAPRPRPRFRKAAIWPRVTFELGQNFVAEHPVVRRAPNSREIGVWNVCEVGTSLKLWLALTITGSASIRPTSATRVSRLASLGRAVARANHEGPAAEPAASTCVLSSSNSARMAWISSRSPGCISPSSIPIRPWVGAKIPGHCRKESAFRQRARRALPVDSADDIQIDRGTRLMAQEAV